MSTGYGVNPLMGTLKPQRNGPLYRIRLLVHWPLMGGTATRGLGGVRPRPIVSK